MTSLDQLAASAPVRRWTALDRTQRWISVLAVAGGVAAILVVADVVSLSTVLFAGAFGGMLLMHVGGHGMHGGHGAPHDADSRQPHGADTIGPDAGASTSARNVTPDDHDHAGGTPDRGSGDDGHRQHGRH